MARERHFARAAEKCYVSQPALSAAIAKLERELGTKLIHREHSFQGLTPEGERLVVWARRILAEYDTLKAEMRSERSEITGTLRLGVIPTAATTVSLMLAAFCSTHPAVRVQVRSALATTELYRQLGHFECDAVIVPLVPEASQGQGQGLDVAPVYVERYVLVAAEVMLPAGASTLRWPDAAKLPLLLLTPDMQVRQLIDRAFGDHGLTASPHVETDSIATLLAQVTSGDWACIVPHTWLSTTVLVGDIRAVQLVEPILKTQIAIVANPAGPVSPAARAFVASAEQLQLHEFFDQRIGPLDADL